MVFSKVDVADVTWDSAAVTLWSAVEPCAGIVSACVPSLRPLISIAVRRLLRDRWPTFVAAGSNKGVRSDGGTSTMLWVLQDAEAGSPPVEGKRNGMEGKDIGVFNTWCTVHSAEKAVDKEAQIMVEEVERPWGGIKVKTEIRWSVQERYDYDDRLY